MAEILFRLLPGPGFVLVPASLSNFIASFVDEKKTWEQPEMFSETEKMKGELYKRVEKARVCCVPVNFSGHWTLLVLERSSVQASPSTAATNPLGSFDKQRRKQAEAVQFNHKSWPSFPLSLEDQWEVRYYDTMNPSISSCKKVAEKMTALLSEAGFGVFPTSLPSPKNLLFQKDNKTCGYWILHYIEEEARVFLGERRGTQPVDLPYRLERLNAMQDTLLTRAAQAEVSAGSK